MRVASSPAPSNTYLKKTNIEDDEEHEDEDEYKSANIYLLCPRRRPRARTRYLTPLTH